MAFVLDQLKPNQKYFEAICGIPHPSTEEKAVSDYVCSVAEKLGLNYEQDKLGNVVVRKPASKGYEDAPVVMLEGHMDMVCVKTPESTHDFSHDPIEIYVDDKGDIRAKDTTLGADDGYGVAYMLAVMEEDFPHPPLELVFTVQEENGCNGVDALDAGKLKSRRMIGLDVMGETVEYTSCVSCFTSDLMKLTKTCETEPAKGAALMLTVSGVQPVHSGAMVHPEQFNAIKITARLLNTLSENGAAYRLSTMAGGEAENYAPVETKTVIFCNKPDTVKAILNGELEKIDRELQDGKQNLTLEIRDTAANGMLSDTDTQAIVDLIYLMPSNTVAIRTAGEEMTATNNVGTVSLNGGAFELVMSDRAASRSFKNGVLGRVKRLAKLCGFTLETSLRYDSWEYQPNSYMRRMTADLMKEVYGHEMMETACPGGLECCSLLPRMKGLDIVMFAPIGENCHTTDEYMNLKSFDRVYDFLKTLLGRLK